MNWKGPKDYLFQSPTQDPVPLYNLLAYLPRPPQVFSSYSPITYLPLPLSSIFFTPQPEQLSWNTDLLLYITHHHLHTPPLQTKPSDTPVVWPSPASPALTHATPVNALPTRAVVTVFQFLVLLLATGPLHGCVSLCVECFPLPSSPDWLLPIFWTLLDSYFLRDVLSDLPDQVTSS